MIFILTTHTQVIVNTWKRAVALNLHFSRYCHTVGLSLCPLCPHAVPTDPLPLSPMKLKGKYISYVLLCWTPQTSFQVERRGGIKTPKRSVSQKITAAIIQWFWKVAFTSITGGLSTVIILILIFSIHGDVHFYLILLKDFFFLLSADWSCSM